jgi:hypothetical protein
MSHRNPSPEFNAVKSMPPLHHSVGKQFDAETSEVFRWLLNQPELKRHLLNRMFHTCNISGFIVFDKATGTWQGKDYKAPPPIIF